MLSLVAHLRKSSICCPPIDNHSSRRGILLQSLCFQLMRCGSNLLEFYCNKTYQLLKNWLAFKTVFCWHDILFSSETDMQFRCWWLQMCTLVDGQKTKKKSDKAIQKFGKHSTGMKDGACFAVLLQVRCKLANSVAPHSWKSH